MADPVTLVGLGATVAGGVVSAFSKRQEAQATAEQYKYKQAVAERNAMYNAAAADVAAQRYGMKARAEEGEFRATKAAGNIDPFSGSAPLVYTAIGDVGRQEQRMAASPFYRKAYSEQEEAKLDVFGAKEAKITGDIGVGTSLLTAAGSVSDKWLQARKLGMV